LLDETDSRCHPTASFPPDLVDRHFDRGRPDAVWLTDITYLTCGEGDMFLCAIRDGHTRKVLGYSISDRISAEMVTDAIDDAVAARGADVVARLCIPTVARSSRRI
jgi:putative transposase